MSTIRECDRCGEQTRHVGDRVPHRWSEIRVNDTTGARTIELCEQCGKKLREFLLPQPRANVEKLARLIHAAVMPEEPWEDCPGMHPDHFALARAAIALMVGEDSDGRAG